MQGLTFGGKFMLVIRRAYIRGANFQGIYIGDVMVFVKNVFNRGYVID